MDLDLLYKILSVGISVICLIASIIVRFAKDGKAKKLAKEIAEKTTDFIELLNGAKSCMFDTESKTNFSSEEKHAYCKTLIIDYCLKHDIDYSQFDIDNVIDYFMEVGNKINARTKEEPAEEKTEIQTEQGV